MNRREFMAAGLVGPMTANALAKVDTKTPSLREMFPRMKQEVYLNAAALMPLSSFGQAALEQYMAFNQLGDKNAGKYVREAFRESRKLFARLIGAEPSEVGMVHCTKAGEQILLDAVDHIRKDGHILTNDLHFSGSLHNLIGMQKAGRHVQIVRAKNWRVSLDEMKAAITDKTAIVTVSLVSNINGHMEAIRELADTAHRHGALLYADIIQAAGIVPIDVKAMGIDVAACSTYKWLYGVYGAGFLYVNQELQGTRLPDRLFPGRVRYNYAPWTHEPDPDTEALGYHANDDAARYEPGHVSYMGYCVAYEGLKFILNHGVQKALDHSVRLNRYLKEKLNPNKYTCISPNIEKVPMITFLAETTTGLRDKLNAGKTVVTIAQNRIRVSPALYNNEGDMDTLAAILNG